MSYPDNLEATPEQIENIISRDKPGSDHLYHLFPQEVKEIKDNMISWNRHTVDDFQQFQRRRGMKRQKQICMGSVLAMILTSVIAMTITTLYIAAISDNLHLVFLFAMLTIITPISVFGYFRKYYMINGEILD